MTNFPWLTVAGAIPLVGTVAVCLTPGRSAPGTEADRRSRDLLVKRIALVFTLITLGVTAAMAANFTPAADDSSSPRSTSGYRSSGSITRWASTGSRSCSS